MNSTPDSDLVAAVDTLVARGGDADEVLRSVLGAVHEHGIEYASVRFLENGVLVDGPEIGSARRSTNVPVLYDGAQVGELRICADASLADRLATLIAPYVLVGWDTAGEPWAP